MAECPKNKTWIYGRYELPKFPEHLMDMSDNYYIVRNVESADEVYRLCAVSAGLVVTLDFDTKHLIVEDLSSLRVNEVFVFNKTEWENNPSDDTFEWEYEGEAIVEEETEDDYIDRLAYSNIQTIVWVLDNPEVWNSGLGDWAMYASVGAPVFYLQLSYQTEHGVAPDLLYVATSIGNSHWLTAKQLPTIEAEGYVFLGWSIDGKVAVVQDKVFEDTVLVAVWKPYVSVEKYIGGEWNLYGGTLLKSVEEFRKKYSAYPYGIIFNNTAYNSVVFYLSEYPFYKYSDTQIGMSSSTLHQYCLRGEDWSFTVTRAGMVATGCSEIIWSSHDVLTADKAGVYFPASEAILLDGMQVIKWDGNTEGLEVFPNDDTAYKVSSDQIDVDKEIVVVRKNLTSGEHFVSRDLTVEDEGVYGIEDGYISTGGPNGTGVYLCSDTSNHTHTVAYSIVERMAEYTITYRTEFGTAPDGKTVSVKEAMSYSLTSEDLSAAAAPGYIFLGWTVDGTTIISNGYEISGDITLSAMWREVALPEIVRGDGYSLFGHLKFQSVPKEFVDDFPLAFIYVLGNKTVLIVCKCPIFIDGEYWCMEDYYDYYSFELEDGCWGEPVLVNKNFNNHDFDEILWTNFDYSGWDSDYNDIEIPKSPDPVVLNDMNLIEWDGNAEGFVQFGGEDFYKIANVTDADVLREVAYVETLSSGKSSLHLGTPVEQPGFYDMGKVRIVNVVSADGPDVGIYAFKNNSSAVSAVAYYPPSFKITYETKKGTAPEAQYRRVEGDRYILTSDDLPKLSVTGFIFLGWTINGIRVSEGTAISSNTVLTASWKTPLVEWTSGDGFALYGNMKLPAPPSNYPYLVLGYGQKVIGNGKVYKLFASTCSYTYGTKLFPGDGIVTVFIADYESSGTIYELDGSRWKSVSALDGDAGSGASPFGIDDVIWSNYNILSYEDSSNVLVKKGKLFDLEGYDVLEWNGETGGLTRGYKTDERDFSNFYHVSDKELPKLTDYTVDSKAVSSLVAETYDGVELQWKTACMKQSRPTGLWAFGDLFVAYHVMYTRRPLPGLPEAGLWLEKDSAGQTNVFAIKVNHCVDDGSDVIVEHDGVAKQLKTAYLQGFAAGAAT